MSLHVIVMAPLVIGDPADLNGEESQRAWQQFREDLEALKNAGVYGIFFDIWWGLVEYEERKYNWSYYDKLVSYIEEAGLMAVPNLSMHHGGGSVGDGKTYQPIPSYVFPKLAAKTSSGKQSAVQYVSEQGHPCIEFVSCWAIDLVIDDYRAFFAEFHRHFADKASLFSEVIVSLGPTGELRYPSYNSHDRGSGFPYRGAFQFKSELALKSFENWVLSKYGNRDAVRKAWGQLDKIEPPVNCNAFIAHGGHFSKYGQDLFDWNQESLFYAGRMMMKAAIDEFQSGAFAGIPVSAKWPGLHWQQGHWEGDKIVPGSRLPELAAGIIRTSDKDDWNSDERGNGYRPIVGFFKSLQDEYPQVPIVMHFTCLEKDDGEDADQGAESLAATMVRRVGAEAGRQRVTIKGENAIGDSLSKRKAWRMMRQALRVSGGTGAYEGLTLLRISDLIGSEVAMTCLKSLTTWLEERSLRARRKLRKARGGRQAA